MATPTNAEQELLELINRVRANPAAEFSKLVLSKSPVTGANADITNALTFFHVDLNLLQQQLSAYASVAPLAWNLTLADNASAHSAKMVQYDQQSHQLPGESDLGTRTSASGYNYSSVGENIFAFATNILYADAGFVIDWGSTATGMQSPPGHRNNILSSSFTEVGIDVTPDSNPNTQVGPLVVTEDFGSRFNYAPQILGVVFSDANGDNFYEAGEGVGGVTVTIKGAGGTFTTTTWSSGGYELAVPAGSYSVTFSGGSLHSTKIFQTSIASANVKIDDNDAVSAVASAASIQAAQTAAAGILRHQLSSSDANTVGLQFDNGALTVATYAAQLIIQAQPTTVPALSTYDFFFGVIPSSAGLDYLTNFANQIQSPGGGGFSVINTFVNLAATFAINPSSSFGGTYGVAATSNEQVFFNSIYTKLFGHAPTQAAINNYFQTHTYNLPNGTSLTGTSFDFYREYVRESLPAAQQTASNLENGARGGVAGTLIYFAEVDSTTQYAQATTHFFQDASVHAPHYQVPLIGAYLASSTPQI